MVEQFQEYNRNLRIHMGRYSAASVEFGLPKLDEKSAKDIKVEASLERRSKVGRAIPLITRD